MSDKRPEQGFRKLNQVLHGNGTGLPPEFHQGVTSDVVTRCRLVRLLFSNPSVGLLFSLMLRRWGLPFMLSLLVFGAGACGKAFAAHKGVRETALHIGQAVRADLAPIKLDDGKLSWRSPDGKRAYARTIEGWRVIARQISWEDYQKLPQQDKGYAGRGILLLKDGVAVFPGDKAGEPVLCLRPEYLELLSETYKLPSNELTQEVMSRWMEHASISLTCVFAVCYWAMYVGTSLFCVLVFGVSAALWGRLVSRGMDGFVIGLNVCLPAALISMLWSWAAPASWDFSSLYYGSFIIYLVLAYLDSRHTVIGWAKVETNEPSQTDDGKKSEDQEPLDKE